MSAVQQLLTEHLAIWTDADTAKRSGRGRSSGNAASVYGVKKLRELILELAVRGKLVPQDVNDEPAGELLQRIQAEKAKLVAAGKIKKDKPLAPIGDEEKLFDLPNGWEWVRIAHIADVKGGKRLPAGHSFSNSVTPNVYIRVTDMKNGTINTEGLIYIDSDTQALISQYTISKDDLYITIAGTIGDVGVVPVELDGMNLTENAAKIIYWCINKKWLQKNLSSNFVQDQFHEKKNQLAQPKLALHRILSSVICLPPLSEQHRIVAKVDELMTLCDQLETQHNNAAEAHEKIVSVLLNSLTQSADANSFTENWQRIAAHFDTLFTTEASIDVLKQTLLQLAVMGKLVPQDANDEPASKLLQCIQAEKAKLVAKGSIKRQKDLLEDGWQVPPYDVPGSWLWQHMDDLFVITGGVTLGRKLSGQVLVSKPYLRVANVQRGSLELDHMKVIEVPESEVDKYSLKKGDLLITEGGDWDKVGRTAIWNNELPECLHQNHVFRARPLLREWVSRWSEIYLNSSAARVYFAGSSKQTTNLASINMTQLRGCAFALPPLKEQHRIVAKVDELMAICDQLKNRITAANQLQKNLADVVVENALL